MDITQKESVEKWGEDQCIDAIELLYDHLFERFGESMYRVEEATIFSDHVLLKITSQSWSGRKEFALDCSGRLIWS